MRVTMLHKIEYEDAEFHMRTPDDALSRFNARATREVVRLAAVNDIDLADASEEQQRALLARAEVELRENMPDDFGATLADMFVEGVVSWEGVEDDEGRPISCTGGTKRAIPYSVKVTVAERYLSKLDEVEEGKVLPPPPPTNSTPPGEQTAD